MRRWLNKSMALYGDDPADTPYQKGFFNALLEVRNELDRRAENRRILIAKLGVSGGLAAIVIAVAWALLTP